MGTIQSSSRGCSHGHIFSRRSSKENQGHKVDKLSNLHNPLTEKISSESRSDVPSDFSPFAKEHNLGPMSSDSESPHSREESAEPVMVDAGEQSSAMPNGDNPDPLVQEETNDQIDRTDEINDVEDVKEEKGDNLDTKDVEGAQGGSDLEERKAEKEEYEIMPSFSYPNRPVVKIDLVKTPSLENQLLLKVEDMYQGGEISPENEVEPNISPILSVDNVAMGPKQSHSSPNLSNSNIRSPMGSPSPSPTPSANNSRFSFFRGIQNVIHVNRWIKKVHHNHPHGTHSHALEAADSKDQNKTANERTPISPTTLKEFEDVLDLPPPELTDRQKELLRTSWHEIGDDINQVGVIAFTGLFDSHPDVQDSFLPFKGLSQTDLSNSTVLREHALRVMMTVEKFVHRMDAPEKIQAIMEDLGQRHFDYKIKVEYINIVGMQFIRAVQPHVSEWTPEMEDAWMTMVNIMTFHMTRGMLDTHQEVITSS